MKGDTMLDDYGDDTELIDFLVEKKELPRRLHSPGAHLLSLIKDEVTELPDIYYVLAWNFKKEILANNQVLIDKGVEFYFPVNPKVSA